ncbi:MAG TPA: alkaline phosphatase D family protein [Rubrobacteraceae bacterium]|nr:alkaline phosphatase D family protein [Rubrobacteraceae bacterium]
MPNLILGPLLRYTGESDATVWVETDSPCEVEVVVGDSSHLARTFHVEGHYYALVRVVDLEPGTYYEYSVVLDGERRWPEADAGFPPSFIRTINPERPFRLAFGSCRITLPQKPPYTLKKDQDKRGRGADALYALAETMRHELPSETDAWPDALLLLGDQVYADEVSLGTLEFIRSRRNPKDGPGETVADFEEYTHLYYDSWGQPEIRWILSTVPSAMIFDDHDVHDDWNTSQVWVEKMRATPWWEERITGGLMSYWIYQHLGNLSPRELDNDETYRKVCEAEDAGPLLRRFARDADREAAGKRWSYYRDFGKVRLLVADSRAGRVLAEECRSIINDEEWLWIENHASGDFDHLLIGTSLPFLIPPALHHAETWNEALCGGAWGTLAAKLGEILRQAVDLEHWSAFGRSFEKLVALLRTVGSGRADADPPASIIVLSGDVHHGYLVEADLGAGEVQSVVYQAVCSPMRNTLGRAERLAMRFGWSRTGNALWRTLARLAGARETDITWRLLHEEPWFENHIGTLELRGREASLKIEQPSSQAPEGQHLHRVFEYRLT